MSAYKLIYEDLEEDDVKWLAIHSTLLNFRMAYFLNQNLQTQFKLIKKEEKLIRKDANHTFTHFEFYDKKLDKFWKLIQNKLVVDDDSIEKMGMFGLESISSTFYVIPEFKKVDFILKIENLNNSNEVTALIQKISNIPYINSVYLLPQKIINTKNNLLYKV
jgi:hypothetical protein